MDADKDGLLSSSDLVAAFTAHGKNIGGGEAQVRKSLKIFEKSLRTQGVANLPQFPAVVDKKACLVSPFFCFVGETIV